MKKLLISCLIGTSIFFSACGGGGGNGTSTPTVVSNVGNNINSLGYYSGDTIFGTLYIESGWSVYSYPTDDTLLKIPVEVWNFDEENEDMWQIYKYPDGFYNAGRYGVNENGTELYLRNYSDDLYTFTYISMVNVEYSSGETGICTKVEINERPYVICN